MPKGKETMVEAQLNNLKPYKKGQSGNPKGRPKNRADEFFRKIVGLKSLRKTQGLSLDEVNTIERKLLEVTQSDLKAIIESEEASIYLKTLARAIIFDMKAGQTKTVAKLREMQYGAITQTVELSGVGGKPLFTMSENEIKDEIERIRNQRAQDETK